MKHIFIINPKAGNKDITQTIIQYLEANAKNITYEYYVTQGVDDALNYVKNYCENHLGENLRFYSCGGDGTLNEIVCGMVGYENVSVACYPSGSGNDFIKVFGNKEDFLNIDALINGNEKKVDIIKVNDRYSLNICNLGFDAVAADNMVRFKKKKFISGKLAYTLGVLFGLFFSLKSHAEVYVDGKKIGNDIFILCTIANGQVYGGGYRCAPNAKVDDGLLDVTLFKPVSRIRLLSLISIYKNGKHLENKRTLPLITYTLGKNVKIIAKKEIIYTRDGEVSHEKEISMEVLPLAINFVLPNNIA